MPDWTYHPLRPLAAAVIGERRTSVVALTVLAALIRYVAVRRWIPMVFDHPDPLPEWSGRFGASVPAWIAREAITVLPVQGADLIAINPVRLADVDRVRRATDGRRRWVSAVVDSAETQQAIAVRSTPCPSASSSTASGSPARSSPRRRTHWPIRR